MAASLLTRIAHAANPHSMERHTWKDQDLEQAVVSHLIRMLNTRQGHALIQPDYGMPDVTEFIEKLPVLVEVVQDGIRNSIEKYEPRLRNVTVKYVPSEEQWPNLRFEITGELVTERDDASVWFETAVNPSGRIEVKG